MKYKIHLFLFLPFFLLTQGFAQNSKSIKELLEEGFDINRVYIGVTLYHKELNRKVSELFLEEFTYTPSENFAKQSQVHPSPKIWKWERIDEFVQFAKAHNVAVRLYGAISTQASKWAKEDYCTAKELDDDKGYADFASYGAPYETPLLDSLAVLGVKFTNFSSFPNCLPTSSTYVKT